MKAIERAIRDAEALESRLDALWGRVSTITRARRPLRGDSEYYCFNRAVEFAQSEVADREITFPIPTGMDFVAERLLLSPSVRFVTTDVAGNGPDEISFRPCFFTWYPDTMEALAAVDPAAIDCLVTMRESVKTGTGSIDRAMQNIPVPSKHLYCGPTNLKPELQTSFGNLGGASEASGALDTYYANFEFPSAFVFDPPLYYSPGSSFTITLSSIFAGVRSDPAGLNGNAELQNQYRISAVLEGRRILR